LILKIISRASCGSRFAAYLQIGGLLFLKLAVDELNIFVQRKRITFCPTINIFLLLISKK